MKVPCAVCAELILPTTAAATGGVCMLCKKGGRVPSAARLQVQKEFLEEQSKPIATMCYRSWVKRLEKFAEALKKQPGKVEVELRIEPCLNDAGFSRAEDRWSGLLPRGVERFWKEGCNGLFFQFEWTPPAKVSKAHATIFGDRPSLHRRLEIVRSDQAHASGWSAEEEEDFWERAIALMDFGNGNQVLLDPGSGADPENPPVVYFNHERDEKMISMIAPSFTVFLQRLEEQAYTVDFSDWLIYDPKRIAYIKELPAFLQQHGLR